jgi:signal transduction histidine kinase
VKQRSGSWGFALLLTAHQEIPMDKANILLVDDQPGKLLSYQAILGGLNQNLVLAGSGREALQRLLTQEFALILLDVIMPDMDGFETATLIRERPRLQDTPIIFLTSYSTSDIDRLKGYELGAVDYVFAPVIPAILLAKASVFVELYRKRQELARVNESLRAEIAERKRAQEQALQAERLAAIGQMVAGLAHESRNSLQQIQAAVEMLARRVQPGPKASLVAEIRKAHDRLHHLLEAVRGYAAPLKLVREEHDLGQLWREAWSQLALVRRGREVQFQEETGDLDLRCRVDPFSIERLFRNVLENSLAACQDPVRIEVRCRTKQCNGQAGVEVGIRDNGKGLTDEQRLRLFEPFYTTKTGGTGLGLAIARRIAEAHGGQIAVGSGPGPGTEIEVFFPKGLS